MGKLRHKDLLTRATPLIEAPKAFQLLSFSLQLQISGTDQAAWSEDHPGLWLLRGSVGTDIATVYHSQRRDFYEPHSHPKKCPLQE